jgi:outer membrane lipoprotein-sorting protein
MVKKFFIFFFIFFFSKASASYKEQIINDLKKINNLTFEFEQRINEKKEKGNCIIEYPKKIFCEYYKSNNKILISNGKSLVVRTDNQGSYYRYQLDKTPLNLILDKEFLINKIVDLDERIVDENYINYTILENDYEINIFFDKQNFNLVGWQTSDIYQNLNMTFISSLKKNQNIDQKIFNLPNP